MKVFICVLSLMAATMADEIAGMEKLFNDANNAFTGKMFSEVVKVSNDNSVVMSAFSVMTPLAQLLFATEGDTHGQLLKTIGLPSEAVTKLAFPLVISKLRGIKGVTLSQASRIYLPLRLELLNDFQTISRDVFRSEVQHIDFNKPVESAKEINSWVESQTNNHIKDLILPNNIPNQDYAVVLLNAIYFKGSWLNAFDVKNTLNGDFHVSKAKTVQMPLMHQTKDFLYAENSELDAQLLEMRYKDWHTSMLIILPKAIDGVSALVDKLKDPSVLNKAMKDLRYENVRVTLPKFKIETTIDLKKTLAAIGLTNIFNLKGELKKLVKSIVPLTVSSAVQKAFIEVNEEGAEAASGSGAAANAEATAVEVSRPLKQFEANHPFVFVIQHNDTLRLFSGVFRS